VVDPLNKPIGGVAISRLLRAPRATPLTELMEPVNEIEVTVDQEEVAYIFEKYHLISAPVVDAGGRLVGQITVDDIVNIIQEENREDILRLAGVSDEDRSSGVTEIVRGRVPWLAINLFTAVLGASVIAFFEGTIQQIVALAVLMPIVSAIGGNAGTQALTVTVRALATRELNASNAMRTFWRELAVGLANGFVLAPLIGLAAGLWFQDWLNRAGIPASMVRNPRVSATVGTVTPLTPHELRVAPAGSAPSAGRPNANRDRHLDRRRGRRRGRYRPGPRPAPGAPVRAPPCTGARRREGFDRHRRRMLLHGPSGRSDFRAVPDTGRRVAGERAHATHPRSRAPHRPRATPAGAGRHRPARHNRTACFVRSRARRRALARPRPGRRASAPRARATPRPRNHPAPIPAQHHPP